MAVICAKPPKVALSSDTLRDAIHNPHINGKTIMAIGLLATITILEGKNEEFESAFLGLTEKVRANEPGNVFYALHKSGSDPQVYKVMEQYDSPEALDAHGKTEYFLAANKQLAGMVAAAPEIEILEAVTR